MINISIFNNSSIAHEYETYLSTIAEVAFPLNISIHNSVSKLTNQYESFDIAFFHVDEENDNKNANAIELIRHQHPDAIWIFTYSGNSLPRIFQSEQFLLNEETPNQAIFIEVFMRAIVQYNTLHSMITLQNNNTRYRIEIRDIKYVEGYNRHIIVYTQDGKYEAVGKVSKAFDILAPHGFIRVHQGYLVNINYIKVFDKRDVILKDGTKVMISARKRKPALQAFDLFSDLLHHQKLVSA